MKDGPKILSRTELRKMLDSDADFTLIEVLSEDDFNEFHLPGAVNIPGNELRSRIVELVPDRNSTVVVYCASPSCTASDRAAELLTSMGYTDVHDFRGGKEHWKEGGLPVSREATATA